MVVLFLWFGCFVVFFVCILSVQALCHFKKIAILLKHIIVIITIKFKNHKRQFYVAHMVH